MRPAPDTAAGALGALTVVTTAIAAVLSAARVGPGALLAGFGSLAGLAATVTAFGIAVARFPMRRRAALGLGLALAAWPIGAVVAALTVGQR